MSSISSRLARGGVPGSGLFGNSRARRWVPIAILACVALVAVAPAQSASGGAGQFAVNVKTAELQGKWGDVWRSMHPAQRAFISQSLFVQCKSKNKLESSSPKTVRAVSVTSRLGAVPGVAGAKVRVRTVTVRIDYGQAAPSQTSLVRLTRVGNAWYTINDASTRKAFTTTNFC